MYLSRHLSLQAAGLFVAAIVLRWASSALLGRTVGAAVSVLTTCLVAVALLARTSAWCGPRRALFSTADASRRTPSAQGAAAVPAAPIFPRSLLARPTYLPRFHWQRERGAASPPGGEDGEDARVAVDVTGAADIPLPSSGAAPDDAPAPSASVGDREGRRLYLGRVKRARRPARPAPTTTTQPPRTSAGSAPIADPAASPSPASPRSVAPLLASLGLSELLAPLRAEALDDLALLRRLEAAGELRRVLHEAGVARAGHVEGIALAVAAGAEAAAVGVRRRFGLRASGEET